MGSSGFGSGALLGLDSFQVGCRTNNHYLNPKSRSYDSPKPLKITQRAIILHTVRVQVGFRV